MSMLKNAEIFFLSKFSWNQNWRFEISHENSGGLALESRSGIESLEILEISMRDRIGKESKRKRRRDRRGRAGCGPGLWLRWQKNRYDVFMRTARVCQADGIAIAARRISGEKHRNSCVSLEARPDLFSITFLRLLASRILPVSSPHPLRRVLPFLLLPLPPLLSQ